MMGTDVRLEPSFLRKVNERRIMNVLRQQQIMSKPAIAKACNFANSTVKRLVDGLLDQQYLRYTGAIDSSMLGRPASLVEINPDIDVAIGIELGRHVSRMVLVNLLADVRVRESIRTDQLKDADAVLDWVDGVLHEHQIERSKLLGVGFAAPGSRNPHSGHFRKNFDDDPFNQLWHQQPLVETTQQRLGLQAWLENDANAAVLGEFWFGQAQGADHLVFVLADIGLGAGIAVNGSIHRGETHTSGSLANTYLHPYDGARRSMSSSNSRVRLGDVADYLAILHAVRTAHADDSLTMADVAAAAKRGEEPAFSIVSNRLDYLATAIANLVRLIDPSKVVLGGGFFFEDEYFMEETIARLNELLLPADLNVYVSPFKELTVSIGAAAMVLQQVYDHSTMV